MCLIEFKSEHQSRFFLGENTDVRFWLVFKSCTTEYLVRFKSKYEIHKGKILFV